MYQTRYRRVDWRIIEEMLSDPNEFAFERDHRKRKAIIEATPPWADREEIRRIYRESVRLSRELKMDFQVVHLIPVRHRLVCGLHVPENLRVVSKSFVRNYPKWRAT